MAAQASKRWTWARDVRDDIDPIVVERLTAGQPVNGTRAERLEAVAQLHAAGMPQPRIAEHLHIHQRQVHRDLHTLGLTDNGRRQRLRDAKRARLPRVLELHAAGLTLPQIARTLGVHRAVVWADLKEVSG